MEYFLIFAISFITTFLITPTIRYVALKFYAIDRVNQRKIHKKLVTKLGGLAIYLGFLGGIFTIVLFDYGFFKVNFFGIATLLICSTLMLILGVYDDFQGSGALLKLSIQLLISLLIIKQGFVLKGIFVPGLCNIEFGFLAVPLTMLWFVGITNAVNLIDGLDGLAAGVCGIALGFISIFGLILRDNFVAFVGLALSGASFAFLKYNFHPAKIFMGDTGSLLLGLVFAYLGVYQPVFRTDNPYFIPAVIVIFLPILDTNIAVGRRILRKKSIFSGDSSHIHHFFLKKGFTQPQTAAKFYITTFILGLISLLVFLFINKTK